MSDEPLQTSREPTEDNYEPRRHPYHWKCIHCGHVQPLDSVLGNTVARGHGSPVPRLSYDVLCRHCSHPTKAQNLIDSAIAVQQPIWFLMFGAVCLGAIVFGLACIIVRIEVAAIIGATVLAVFVWLVLPRRAA